MPDITGLTGGRVTRLLDRFERLVAGALRRVTGRMAVEVGRSPTPADVTIPDVAAIPTLWADQVDGRLMPQLVKVWERSAVEVARQILGEQPPLAATVADYMAAARPRMVRVGDLVWNQVAVSLSDGLAAGENVRQLSARVRAAAGVAQPRALVVARTEVQAAVQAAAYAQVQMLGDPTITKRWRTEHDERVRPTHRDADGQTVDLPDMFKVGTAGLLYPGYPLGPPGEIIQCRCEVVYGVPAPLVAAVRLSRRRPSPVVAAAVVRDASGRCHGPRGRFIRCGDAGEAVDAVVAITVDATGVTDRVSKRVTGARVRAAERKPRVRKFASQDVAGDLRKSAGLDRQASTRIKKTMRQIYTYTDKETGLKVRVHEATAPGGTAAAVAQFVVEDEKGFQVGQGTRYWFLNHDTGELTVTHSLLLLDPDKRGGGFAARFNAQAEQAYQQAGVAEIQLHADMDVGGYAWAVQGYDFRDQKGLDNVVALARKHRSGGSAAQVRDLLARAEEGFDSPNRPTPYEFAMIGRDRAVPRELPSGRTILIWPGKTMMTRTNWHGSRRVQPPVTTAAAGGASLLDDVALDALAYALVVADDVPADIADVAGLAASDPEQPGTDYPPNHHLFSAQPDVEQVFLDMADATLDAHGLGGTPPPADGEPDAAVVVTAAGDRDYTRDDRGRFAKHASDVIKGIAETVLGGELDMGLRRDGGVTIENVSLAEGVALHLDHDEIQKLDDAIFRMWRQRDKEPMDGEDELIAEETIDLKRDKVLVGISNRVIEETNEDTGQTEYFNEPVLNLVWGENDEKIELDSQDFDLFTDTLTEYQDTEPEPVDTIDGGSEYDIHLMFDGSLQYDGENTLTIPPDEVDDFLAGLEHLDQIPVEKIESVGAEDSVDGFAIDHITADLFGDGTIQIINSDTGEDATIDISDVAVTIAGLKDLIPIRDQIAAEIAAEDQPTTAAVAIPGGDTVPWHIEANADGCPAGKPWAVVKDADATVEGCHATRSEAVDQLRALYATEPGHTGAMVALIPNPEHAARLAVDDGEPADELHLTLAYLGDAAGINPVEQAQLIANLAGQPWPGPVRADGFAVSLFNPGNPDRDTCAVLGCSGGDLDTYRDTALNVARAVLGDRLPAQHEPFVPHVILRYADEPGMVEAYADRAGPVVFDRLRMAFAGQYVDLPLVDTPTPTEPSTVETAEVYDDGPPAEMLDEAALTAAGPVEHFHTIVRENRSTGWRTFLPGSLEWRDPPFAFHWQIASSAHGGDPVVVQVGNITRIERHGEEVHMWGPLDLADPTAVEYGRKLADGFAIWSSVGADESVQDKDIEMVYPEGTSEEEQMFTMPTELLFHRFRIAEATGVSVPAQADADVEALPALRSALADLGVLVAATSSTAGVSVVEPPPAWWFNEPIDVEMRGALTVTDEGRIYGLVAPAGLRHRDRGVTVPAGRVDYTAWMGGEVITAGGGRVVAGPITMDCGHAAVDLRPFRARRDHYENTCSVVARAAVGETANRDVWFAGALMPGLDPNTVARIMACRLSGDWQPHPQRRGWSEFIAALLVPVPAFAMARTGPSVSYDQNGVMVASAVPVRYQPCGRLAGHDPDGDLAAALDRIVAPYGLDRRTRLDAQCARHPLQ